MFSINKKFWLASCVISYVAITSYAAGADAEKYKTGWRLDIDNNIFKRYMKDRDYTGGIAFTVSGGRAQSGWLNIDPLRSWLFDRMLTISPTDVVIQRHRNKWGQIKLSMITASPADRGCPA
jgi:hypothetical protein